MLRTKIKEMPARAKFALSTGLAAGSSVALPMVAFAEGESDSAGVLTTTTSVLTWATTSMTSITTWLIGNPLGQIYLAMFIIGFAVALMFRVLHSA